MSIIVLKLHEMCKEVVAGEMSYNGWMILVVS